MTRIIYREDTYVIQGRFFWTWVDETALDDYGNALPCIYAFDTLEEALKYSDSDCMVSVGITRKLLDYCKEKQDD